MAVAARNYRYALALDQSPFQADNVRFYKCGPARIKYYWARIVQLCPGIILLQPGLFVTNRLAEK